MAALDGVAASDGSPRVTAGDEFESAGDEFESVSPVIDGSCAGAAGSAVPLERGTERNAFAVVGGLPLGCWVGADAGCGFVDATSIVLSETSVCSGRVGGAIGWGAGTATGMVRNGKNERL